MSYSFIYVGLLPRSDFQHVGMDHSWIWRLISLKNNCSENIHKFGYKFGESWNCKCCGNRTVFKLGVADFWVKWKYYRNMISFHVCLHTEIERCVLKHKLRESGKARPNFYMKFGLWTKNIEVWVSWKFKWTVENNVWSYCFSRYDVIPKGPPGITLNMTSIQTNAAF